MALPIVDSAREMIIVAHPDDDILFMNPDISRAIALGREVTAVFTTAGDAGQVDSYWEGREAGIKAAYGLMAGANDWVDEIVTLSSGEDTYEVASSYLASAPGVRLYFMRLPDGGGGGLDGETYNSLTLLLEGGIDTVTTEDGAAVYDREDVTSILTALMDRHQPDQFRVHDHASEFAAGEHRDHVTTALFTDAALSDYQRGLYAVTSYVFYGSIDLRRNLTPDQATAARDVFLQYATGDPDVFDSEGALTNLYAEWVQRQFVASEIIVDLSGTASASGRYFFEDHNSGIFDPTDQPVAGAFVYLTEAATGTIVSTAVTDLSGTYRFHGLTPGTEYQIQFEAPTTLGSAFLSFGFSNANVGSDDSQDSDVVTVDAEGLGRTATFVAVEASAISHLDAAIYNANPAQITGRYFIDANGDGLHNSDESGVAGAMVELLDTSTGRIIASTTTDASGDYSFTGLTASDGAKVLFESVDALSGSLSDFVFTDPRATASPSLDSDVTGLDFRGWGETEAITLGAGQIVSDVDAGLRAPTGGSISGRYFLDLDRDGIEAPSDLGISGALVYLFADGVPGRIAVTTTDAQGRYSFEDLAPHDRYRVFFDSPDALGDLYELHTFAPANEGEDDRIDSDVTALTADGRLRTDPIHLGQDQTVTNIDAGLATPLPGTISGRYFLDRNGNGLDDGETGVSGASVWLFQGDTEITATSTDTRGEYRFNDVPVGEDYFIFFENPMADANVRFVDSVESEHLHQITSDVSGVGLFGSGATGGFDISAAQNYQGIDAGLTLEGTLPVEDMALSF